MSSAKVAIIVTSHTQMGGPDTDPTGVWLEELTTPYYAMTDAGLDVTVFTIAGGEVPVDPRSIGGDDEPAASVKRYRDDDAVQALFHNTPSVEAVDVAKYDVVFLPGGHGTMFDYPKSETLKKIVERTIATDKIMAAVCHGPAGLVTATDSNGQSLLKGRRVAGFTNSEEDGVGLSETVPFLLEDRLKALGANYVSGPDWAPFAVRDASLITGQNPASATAVTDLILEVLEERSAKG
ncbi:dimethylallyltransferase [Algimonas ampicilliniresistens]|uniref:Dimethylallyltransferase n=1 Tax=Algimonas ampicilliniresistens TaxID=1298735 RepID=A0ABQ5V8V1_9PROT|nr:type 1 glutamine amidotransferase domain-containing protein [Algimonas ampicilliniresistens]GLQ22717.1 dimethylallyltransferase [Algimonas ampicilliniresistens]